MTVMAGTGDAGCLESAGRVVHREERNNSASTVLCNLRAPFSTHDSLTDS